MKLIAKRIAVLESRIKPKEQTVSRDYKGILMNELISEMDNLERDALRQALLFAKANIDTYKDDRQFKLLETAAKSAMDAAHIRITSGQSRHG
jgi:hypothetical protein